MVIISSVSSTSAGSLFLVSFKNKVLDLKSIQPVHSFSSVLLMEEGERIEDHYGLLWKKPINKTDEKECTGWIDFRSKTLFLKRY